MKASIIFSIVMLVAIVFITESCGATTGTTAKITTIGTQRPPTGINGNTQTPNGKPSSSMTDNGNGGNPNATDPSPTEGGTGSISLSIALTLILMMLSVLVQ